MFFCSIKVNFLQQLVTQLPGILNVSEQKSAPIRLFILSAPSFSGSSRKSVGKMWCKDAIDWLWIMKNRISIGVKKLATIETI